MRHIQEAPGISKHAQRTLRREMWFAQGRFEAFEFALEAENLEQLKTWIQEIEERLSDPVLLQGPMRPHTSTRISREGYVAGLKDALKIIADNET